MRYLVLDTCAVLHIIRQDQKGKDFSEMLS